MSFRVLLLALLVVLIASREAMGEDPVVRTQAVDSFPTALGYAVLAAVTAAGGALVTVIGKLHYGGLERDKVFDAAIEAANGALAKEKDARREEAEIGRASCRERV